MEEAKNKTILIVDDDKFLLNMYRMKFAESGFVVETATSGQETLQILRTGTSPQILMLDMVMPGMDGIELLETIRKEKLASSAHVVILSNQSQASDMDKAKEFGIDGYIVKATSIPSEVVQEVIKVIKVKN
ncbi:MAG: hypothetical protein A2928_02685 [Candidatus Taylorbacteria bacterium RIFCSPLOWO2_01_FULL_45_15b]|uniref:Response regulatory domain-containing protein n=1 Tax=Candidatus Taylorbacteria bacterium RIFCSPLOWO2_01_FULL_45_15b TaxID=1802319 RepID=A0A1G2N7K6_9BACT|nr:MAG: hypothetical protein A2928_02685 [Candidatus Taylorbacteria bacterium RIFCSPLOWO2_01_FULL_45_15b]